MRCEEADVDAANTDDDASEKKKSTLVDVFDTDKDKQSQNGQDDGAVDSHIVEQGRAGASPFWRNVPKDGHLWCYVDLDAGRKNMENML